MLEVAVQPLVSGQRLRDPRGQRQRRAIPVTAAGSHDQLASRAVEFAPDTEAEAAVAELIYTRPELERRRRARGRRALA